MRENPSRKTASVICMCLVPMLAMCAEPAVNAWDPQGRLPDALDVRDKATWKTVPDGTKGGYSFRGDAVVENTYLVIVLSAAKAKALVYSKPRASRARSAVLSLIPARGHGVPERASWKIREKVKGKIALEGAFRTRGGKSSSLSAVFVLHGTTLAVQPGQGVAGIRVVQQMDYGLIPTIIGEDQRYDPSEHPASTTRLHIPAENVFIGLLPGEDRLLVATWPAGKQRLLLTLGKGDGGRRSITGMEATLGGQPFFLTIVSYPGIWHRETLDESYLDSDVLSSWKKPFESSRWRVQGTMRGVPSSLEWRPKKGIAGLWGLEKVMHPAWFDGRKAYFRLSKKIPDTGVFLAYPVGPKRKNAPVDTPVDIMRSALGWGTANAVLDFGGEYRRKRGKVPGWKLSEGYPYVDGSYSCHVCPVLYATFSARREVEEKQFVQAILWDQSTLFATQRQRIMEFMELAWDLRRVVRTMLWTRPPGTYAAEVRRRGLSHALAGIEEIVAKMESLYEPQKVITSPEYWKEHDRAIMGLTERHGPENLAVCMDHACKLHHVGVIQTHKLPVDLLRETRKLYTVAGHACVNTPDAVPVVEEIRRRIRKCLRTPYWSQRGVGGR